MRKNTFVLVGTVLEKPDFVGPSRHVQNVCAVTKGGTVLKLRDRDLLVMKDVVVHRGLK